MAPLFSSSGESVYLLRVEYRSKNTTYNYQAENKSSADNPRIQCGKEGKNSGRKRHQTQAQNSKSEIGHQPMPASENPCEHDFFVRFCQR
jgi:hypothetical protein